MMCAVLHFIGLPAACLLFGLAALVAISRSVMVIGDLIRFVRSLHQTDDEPAWEDGEP